MTNDRPKPHSDLKTLKIFDKIYRKDEGRKTLKNQKGTDTMEKMTYVKALNAVLANENLETEIREKLEALVISLEKRNAKVGERKPTKTQRENEAIKEAIVERLNAADEPIQTKVIAQDLSLSIQKASALLKQLVTEGAVVKTEGAKHVSLFSLPEFDEV